MLRQRGEVSEVILKMEHEKAMKSATLLADRNARISADRAQTAELKLFAIQQQQRVRTYSNTLFSFLERPTLIFFATSI